MTGFMETIEPYALGMVDASLEETASEPPGCYEPTQDRHGPPPTQHARPQAASRRIYEPTAAAKENRRRLATELVRRYKADGDRFTRLTFRQAFGLALHHCFGVRIHVLSPGWR